jgi:hypothetical protein
VGFIDVTLLGIFYALVKLRCFMYSIYRYFVNIKPGRLVLWCYLIWYLVTVYFHFDSSPKIWINSLGISFVIGSALMLSVSGSVADRWQTFRLYWMPFAVSSFAALIKNKGYFVIFSPSLYEVCVVLSACGVFVVFVAVVKWTKAKTELQQGC